MRALEQAQLTLRSLLARGLSARRVAQLSGLSRASEVWGGATPLDRPAWYVWLDGVRGAYRLDLEDAAPLELPQAGAPPPPEDAVAEPGWHARFSIRYYPLPEEPCFAGFSAQERDTVVGAFFDATGTPRIEVAHRIPPDQFLVGSLEWAETPDHSGTVVALSSLDHLRLRCGVPGGDTSAAPRTIGRDVPGWALSTPLLAALGGLHAQVQRHALERAVLASQPGFEVVAEGEGTYACCDTEEVVRGDALLGFAAADAPGASIPLVEALRDEDASTVADEHFDGTCRHPRVLECAPRIPLPVSHAWFGGVAHVEAGLTCSC